MLENSKKAQIIEQVTENKKFFEVRITLKIFGVTVLDYIWPPQKS